MKFRHVWPVLALAVFLGLLALVGRMGGYGGPGPETAKVQTVAALDLLRYMGHWYEVAKVPNRYQTKCAGHAQADYVSQGDGKFKVISRCRLPDGTWDTATGQGRQIGAANSPTLESRFMPSWLSFIPPVWSKYWVVDLDSAYQLAAVSEPSGESLWILARAPHVAPQAYSDLLERLRRQGLPVQRLVVTDQDP